MGEALGNVRYMVVTYVQILQAVGNCNSVAIPALVQSRGLAVLPRPTGSRHHDYAFCR